MSETGAGHLPVDMRKRLDLRKQQVAVSLAAAGVRAAQDAGILPRG